MPVKADGVSGGARCARLLIGERGSRGRRAGAASRLERRDALLKSDTRSLGSTSLTGRSTHEGRSARSDESPSESDKLPRLESDPVATELPSSFPPQSSDMVECLAV